MVLSINPPPTQNSEVNDNPKDFLYFLKMQRKSNPCNLIAGSLNINSLRNKFQTVKYILQNEFTDILALCETKLDESFPEDQFNIPNYVCHRKDRTSHGGGLIIYARSDIPQRRRLDIESSIDSLTTGTEIIIVELILSSKERWFYISGYKPPCIKDSVMISAFDMLCDKLLNESQTIVILGDYNCDFMMENVLASSCVSFDLHNLVKSPTCHMTSKGTLLDLCLVSQPMRFKKSLNLECWLSDCHNFICITTKLSVSKQSPDIIRYHSFKHFVDEQFVHDLYLLSELMESNKDEQDSVATQMFCDSFINVVEHHAPLKTKYTRHNNVPFINSQWRK